MIEFELKFQIPPARRDAVRAFVAGSKRPALRPLRLQASYFDTPQRLLARSGIALRVRREGAAWVQTLKGAAPDGLGREECNHPLDDGDDINTPPDVDPLRHRGVPLGDQLIDLLASNPDDRLQCSYRSEVMRLQRQLKTRFGTVELAFDEGQLIGAGDRLAICELEIELITGHPMAVIDVARRWAMRFGLWLDTRSKAERGDLLSRGLNVSPPHADIAQSALHEQHPPRMALQASIASVRNPILANASQIASGRFDPEHVHQLRVMLRRLRVMLRLFGDDPAAAELGLPLVEPAADLFRGLGAGRDRSVLAGPVSADIQAALRQAGEGGELPLPGSDDADAGTVELVRSSPSQSLLLSLVEVTLSAMVDAHASVDSTLSLPDPGHSGGKPARTARLRRLLLRRLGHWQASISRAAGNFDELDENARHQLRKHVKRLRYAIDAADDVLDKRRAKAIRKPLKQAQQVLGEINDLATALRAFDRPDAGHRDWFARGWLIARQQALIGGGVKSMNRLARATRKKKLR